MSEQEIPFLVEVDAKESRSKTIGKLVGALAAAQLEYEIATKDTVNPIYSSKYADLATIIAATQKALAKHELVVIQTPIIDLPNQKAGVLTLLAHSSDEWISNELILPAVMQGKATWVNGVKVPGEPRFDNQSVGGALTYARRYAYQAILGVAAEVDDDGNSAAGLNGKDAADQIAKDKVNQVAREVTIQYAGAFMYLRGPGDVLLGNVLRSAGTKNATWGNVWTIPIADAVTIIAECERVGVTVTEGQMPGQPTPKPNGAVKSAPVGQETPSQSLPGEKRVDRVVEKATKQGQPFATITWDGKDYSCFHGSIYALLKTGSMANLKLETKGKYTNIIGLVSLNGQTYSENQDGQLAADIQRGFEASDSDLPEGMFK